MTTPSTPSDSPESRQPASTQGGASSKPTPANNVGGGAGWGDEGFHKGGMFESESREGPGHGWATNARSTIGGFLGLSEQKTNAEHKHVEAFDRAAGIAPATTDSGDPTCESEDHSFMNHTPGCPSTLPGWGKAKNLAEGLHKQGR